MLQRFSKLIESIKNILWKYPESPPMITVEQNLFIEDIIPILRLFNDIKKTVSSEKNVTISRLLAICDFMTIDVQGTTMRTGLSRVFQQCLLNELKISTEQLENNKIVAAATLLDPRFKKIHFSDPVKCSNGKFSNL